MNDSGAADIFGQDRVYPEESFLFVCHLWGYHDLASRLAPGSLILDLACGEGYGAQALSDAGHTVVALDLEAGVVADASTRYTGPSFVAGDALRLPFADRSFDAVGALQTIEHLAEASPFLAECARVLRPDGLCYLTTPNIAQLPETASKEFNPWHLRDFTPPELAAECAAWFEEVNLYGQMLDESLPRVQRLLELARREWEVVDRVARVERMVRRLPGPMRVRLRPLLLRVAGVGDWPHPDAEAARRAIEPSDFHAEDAADRSGCTIAVCGRPRAGA
ncbi:MAG: class I SAM-dependent methyltransferase [Actinomycetota bacterium]